VEAFLAFVEIVVDIWIGLVKYSDISDT